MNRQNFYFGKLVDINEMDELQNNTENSINLLKIIIGKGLMKGGNLSINNLSLTIDETIAFDKDGNNILIDSQILDLSSFVPAQDKIVISIAANFTREYSQEEIDDQGNPVFFKQSESSHINFIEGQISPNPVPPEILDSQVLIADITLSYGQSVITSDNISYSRVKRFNAEGKKIIDIFDHLLENYYKKDETFFKSNNLSDVPNKTTARSNLLVYSKSEVDANLNNKISKLGINIGGFGIDSLETYPINNYLMLGEVNTNFYIEGTFFLCRGENSGVMNFTKIDIVGKSSSDATTKLTYCMEITGQASSVTSEFSVIKATYNSKTYFAIKYKQKSNSYSYAYSYFRGIIKNSTDILPFIVNNQVLTEDITYINSTYWDRYYKIHNTKQLFKNPISVSSNGYDYQATWDTGSPAKYVLITHGGYYSLYYRQDAQIYYECYNVYVTSSGNEWRKINEAYIAHVKEYNLVSGNITEYFFSSTITGVLDFTNAKTSKIDYTGKSINGPLRQGDGDVWLPQLIPPGGYSKYNKTALPYDDILANLHLRFPNNFSVSFTGTNSANAIVSELSSIFKSSRNTYARIGLGNLDNVMTLWIDCSTLYTFLGIVVSWGTNSKAKDVKIETSQDNINWTVKSDLSNRISAILGYDYAIDSSSLNGSGINSFRYIRITMKNWETIYHESNRLLRVSAFSNTGTGEVFLEKQGGSLYGPLDMKNNNISNVPNITASLGAARTNTQDVMNKSYVNAQTRAATIVIAAYNSLHKEGADYVCDGSDDQILINQALADNPSGLILLLEGAYNLSGPIVLLENGITFRGCGNGTILSCVNTGIDMIQISANYTTIENLAIDGGITNKSANCIKISGNHATIKNCIILNGGKHINILNSYATIQDNDFISLSSLETPIYCSHNTTLTDIKIINNNFEYQTTQSSSVVINFEPSGSLAVVQRLVIDNNKCFITGSYVSGSKFFLAQMIFDTLSVSNNMVNHAGAFIHNNTNINSFIQNLCIENNVVFSNFKMYFFYYNIPAGSNKEGGWNFIISGNVCEHGTILLSNSKSVVYSFSQFVITGNVCGKIVTQGNLNALARRVNISNNSVCQTNFAQGEIFVLFCNQSIANGNILHSNQIDSPNCLDVNNIIY